MPYPKDAKGCEGFEHVHGRAILHSLLRWSALVAGVGATFMV
jgi:hypothetical protein